VPQGRPTRKKRASGKPGAAPFDWTEAIARQSEGLQAGAFSAGLMRVRNRSSPERLVREVHQFLQLVACAMEGSDKASLHERVRREVRSGAFTGASEREVVLVFAVWRRALHAFFTGARETEPFGRMLLALERLEDDVCSEARSWAGERIDLIALAASAGGLPVLEQLVSAFQPDLPATVVVVLHVAPHAPSFLADILARKARIPVTAAVDGGALHLGTTYIAPPGHHLAVTRRHTRLVGGPEVQGVKPAADVLFSSAAQAFRGRLASVVLTGTGSDGAAGTRAVLASGGLTFAQDPSTAQYTGMPAAAIATGAVQHTLPLARLAEALVRAAVQGRRDLVHA
jgi:two-component system chemotaxis response regulator CheB